MALTNKAIFFTREILSTVSNDNIMSITRTLQEFLPNTMFLKYNSDRINSEDREHGATQCQSLCERVYDEHTYWIYRLQEQTCEVWSLNIFLLPYSLKKIRDGQILHYCCEKMN